MRPHAFFITLTYDDLHLPVFSGQAELYKPDLVKFIDAIRRKLPKITIFAVGEYGGKKFGNPESTRDIHPHYHLAIFSDASSIHDKIRGVCERTWKFGHVHCLQLSGGLIDYITGYVSKKLTNAHSMAVQAGLNIRPEFTYSSRRPAIGDITDQLVPIVEQYGDIDKITIDSKLVQIPKYLKFKLKDYFLKWDLDLKNPDDLKEYERRKHAKKIETMQMLYDKAREQEAQIETRPISGDLYSKKRQLRNQMILNFESKLARKSYNKKVL